MQKIGVITLVDYNNYGNRFQNYATHKVLSSMGYDVETIDYTIQQNNSLISRIRRGSKLPINQIISRIKKNCIKNTQEKKRLELQKRKESNFRDFSSKYINEYKITIRNKDDLENLNKRYDYFVVGSDQVWNPFFFNNTNNNELNFLPFASKHKRIAFSASFGIDYIPDNYSLQFKKWISDFEYISLREESGQNIVKELTGRDSFVLIDPTLMLSRKEWLSISKPIDNFQDSDYIITYMIGSEAELYRDLVKKYAEKHDIKLINLADYSDDRYTIDPSEFISYINNAKAVFTNSFHGTIFSIIFEKPFIVFNRVGNSASMNTRIDTLLSKFNFKERLIDDLEHVEDIFDIDFSQTNSIIENERKKAYEFLKTSLKIKSE